MFPQSDEDMPDLDEADEKDEPVKDAAGKSKIEEVK